MPVFRDDGTYCVRIDLWRGKGRADRWAVRAFFRAHREVSCRRAVYATPDEARQAKARIMIEGIETALKLYRLDNGFYPSTDQGLQALVEASTIPPVPRNWREGGYLEKGKVPKDPWGNDFVYLCPGTQGEFDLLSYGADGQPGGEGKNKDITNWGED